MEENRSNIGLKRLIQQFKNEFEIEENINYYSFKDFSKSRRKYLKFMLKGASCQGTHCEGNRI